MNGVYALGKLEELGYCFSLNGEKISFEFQGKKQPDASLVKKWFDQLGRGKHEALVYLRWRAGELVQFPEVYAKDKKLCSQQRTAKMIRVSRRTGLCPICRIRPCYVWPDSGLQRVTCDNKKCRKSWLLTGSDGEYIQNPDND